MTWPAALAMGRGGLPGGVRRSRRSTELIAADPACCASMSVITSLTSTVGSRQYGRLNDAGRWHVPRRRDGRCVAALRSAELDRLRRWNADGRDAAGRDGRHVLSTRRHSLSPSLVDLCTATYSSRARLSFSMQRAREAWYSDESTWGGIWAERRPCGYRRERKEMTRRRRPRV